MKQLRLKETSLPVRQADVSDICKTTGWKEWDKKPLEEPEEPSNPDIQSVIHTCSESGPFVSPAHQSVTRSQLVLGPGSLGKVCIFSQSRCTLASTRWQCSSILLLQLDNHTFPDKHEYRVTPVQHTHLCTQQPPEQGGSSQEGRELSRECESG